MEDFEKEIEVMFHQISNTLIWCLEEYDLDINQAKAKFIEYANNWFNDYAAAVANQEKDLAEWGE